MQFNDNTLQILKNYSTINNGIFFREGNTLSTISSNKTILAKSTIDENITGNFAIYDLSNFLATLSLFDNPEIVLEDKNLVIKQGRKRIKYTFANPETIVVPPSKAIKFPSPEVEFELKSEDLNELTKALSVLQLPEIAVVCDGENLTLDAIDSKDDSGNRYSIDLGKSSNPDRFRMIIKAEYLRIIPGDYKVEISSKGLSRFYNDTVEYFLAVESNSTYGE